MIKMYYVFQKVPHTLGAKMYYVFQKVTYTLGAKMHYVFQKVPYTNYYPDFESWLSI